MSNGGIIHGLVSMTGAVLLLGSCAQALLGDKEYVLETGTGTGGSAETTTDGGAGGGGVLVCDKGYTVCGDGCVRLESDQAHCGYCGHDCLDADCYAGLCEPFAISGAQSEPQGVGLDLTHAYWTSADGTVQRVAKGGGMIELLADEQEGPRAITVDATHVYWINEISGNVMRVLKDASDDPEVFLDPKTSADSDSLRSIALDADSIYLSRKLAKGQIRRVGKSGSGPKILATDQARPSDICLLGGLVIWAGHIDADDNGGEPIGGYIRLIAAQGGEVTTLAAGEGRIAGLTASAGRAIWADGTNQVIRVRAMVDRKPTNLVEGQDVSGLAADETNVVWSTKGGTVRSFPLNGGTARVLAIDIAAVGAVAVDETHVYFVREGAGGAVLRVAK